jgi:hypothetical protein
MTDWTTETRKLRRILLGRLRRWEDTFRWVMWKQCVRMGSIRTGMQSYPIAGFSISGIGHLNHTFKVSYIN